MVLIVNENKKDMETSQAQQKLMVKQGRKVHFISVEKICVIIADSNYSTIYFEDKKS